MSSNWVANKRILILTNHLVVGGAEVYVLTVSQWLMEHGATVAIAATPGELVDQVSSGVSYHPIHLTDVRVGFPVAVFRVKRLIARFKPDIVIANSLVTTWVARTALWPRSIPVVAIGHGWPVDRYGVVSRLLGFAHRVVPVSEEVAGRLKEGGLHPSKMRVVPNGVDLRPFENPSPEVRKKTRQTWGAQEGHLVVSNIGRYTEQKAQYRIIQMAEQLGQSHPHIHFWIIGYGEKEAELREGIRHAGVESTVKLLVNRRDIPDLLNGSDVYINVSDWEGMPLSTIEAMGAGLPVVATDVEGVGALLDASPTGNALLCPVGDVAQLTDAVRSLNDDIQLREQKGKASWDRARNHFSQDHMCSNLTKVMAELL
jgi:glycosyltransferase involved in cell wall biosynthesis